MKEYKYTINGNKYVVAIGDIEDNIATLTVNGEEFKVEMEREAEPEKKKPVVRPAGAAAEPAGDAAAFASAHALSVPCAAASRQPVNFYGIIRTFKERAQ